MIFLTSYYKDHKVGLSNYLKVLFSTYRVNSIINKDKIVPCVDKDFDFIYSSCFSNKEFIYDDVINNEGHGLAFDNNSVFLEDCVVAFEGGIRQYNFKSDVYYNVPNLGKLYNFDDDFIIKTFGWRFYVKPTDNVNTIPFSNEWYLREQTSTIDLRYSNIPRNIINVYLDIINKFNINEQVLNSVNEFLCKINGDFLGVHIRTWNTNGSLSDNRSSNERYKWYIDKDVLISTDNIDEVKVILPYIKDKNIHFIDKINDLNDIQNDFKDILLLSKSKYLIGSLNSTFSELSWWYGGCKSEVEII